MNEEQLNNKSPYYDHPLTRKVIGHAIEVHRELGPGLLESAYELCLAQELRLANIEFKQQMSLPIYFKGVDLECGYRLDFLVEDFLVVELKAVDSITGVHKAQILTYMKLAEVPIGLLLNFNVGLLRDGVHKFVL